MKSIISNDKVCILCGDTRNLHKHHIFYGTANRRLSEKYGCWCYLCAKHHNMSSDSVHMNHQLDLQLKQATQIILEHWRGWSRERFIQTFGRSYLDQA